MRVGAATSRRLGARRAASSTLEGDPTISLRDGGLFAKPTVRDIDPGRNRPRPGSVQTAMTVLETLPPMHDRGAFALSRAPFDDAAHYGRLLAAAPTSRRCPVLLADHALGSLQPGWEPGMALARLPR